MKNMMQCTVNCSSPVQLATGTDLYSSTCFHLRTYLEWVWLLEYAYSDLHFLQPPCLSWLQKHAFNFSKLHLICVLVIWKLEPDGQKLQEGMHGKIQELPLVFSFLLTQFPGNIGGKGASYLKDILTASKTTNEDEKRQLCFARDAKTDWP